MSETTSQPRVPAIAELAPTIPALEQSPGLALPDSATEV